jgi:hypothetical protein
MEVHNNKSSSSTSLRCRLRCSMIGALWVPSNPSSESFFVM